MIAFWWWSLALVVGIFLAGTAGFALMFWLGEMD